MNKTVVVFDTNIFISAVFWNGNSYALVKKSINQEIIVFISAYIIKEIRNVLIRDFNLQKQEIDDVINAVFYFTHLIEPKEKVQIIKEDPADDRILECALACNANFIITYDKKLLNLKSFRNINIVNPEEFKKTFN